MYKSSKDIIEINGRIYSNVLTSDFAPGRSEDAFLREMDSNGSFQDYENPNKSGEITLSVRSDNRFGNEFKKELRRLMETGEYFTINRNNYNKGGQKETYKRCLVMNDGSNGRGKDGKLTDREWKISYENYDVDEGAY